MQFLQTLKIWLLTNIGGAIILTLYMSIIGEAEGGFAGDFFGFLLLIFTFGLLFSIPAIPVLMLTLYLAEENDHVSSKITILLFGSAFSVFAVLLVGSQLLSMPIISTYGENLLEFTWPHIFTSIISTFIVLRKSIFYTDAQSTDIKEVGHES